MANKQQIIQHFYNNKQLRSTIKLPPRLQTILEYCQYVLQSKLIKGKKTQKYKSQKTQQPQTQFCEAYKALNLDQKASYYFRNMRIITKFINHEIQRPQTQTGILFDYGYIRSISLKIWRQKNLRLNRQQKILYAEYEKNIKVYSLSDYIMRQSKNTDYHSFVLEAINKNPSQKQQTVHIGFKDQQKLKIWKQQLNKLYNIIEWHTIFSHLKNTLKLTSTQIQQINTKIQYKSPNTNLQQTLVNNHSLLEKTNINMSKSGIKNSDNLQQTIKLSKSVIVNKQQKSRAMSLDVQEYYQEGQQNPSNLAFTSLGTVTNDLQYFSFARNIKKQQQQQEPNNKISEQQQQKVLQKMINKMSTPNKLKNRKPSTIIQSIASINHQQIQKIQEQDYDISSEQDQFRENIFQKIFPQYNLDQAEKLINYHIIQRQNNLKIWEHNTKPNCMKAIINLGNQLNIQDIISAFCNPQLAHHLNPQIQFGNIKTMIKSENSAMIYQKNRPYNRLYRARDFIFLRHVFSKDNKYYIADKSVQSINHPPFSTIARGQLTNIWTIKRQQNMQDQSTLIICDIKMKNNGYLSQKQQKNLTMKFFKGFVGIQNRIANIKNSIYEVFRINWKISSLERLKQISNSKFNSKKNFKQQPSDHELSSPKHPRFQTPQKKTHKNQDKLTQISPYKKISEMNEILGDGVYDKVVQNTISDQNEQQIGQIPLDVVLKTQRQIEQLKTLNEIKRDFDEKGHVIISNDFKKTIYLQQPLQKTTPKYLQAEVGHPIWKNDWKHDLIEGAIIFINQKKIQDQKGVLKFILRNIGKNILSGKSVMNLSLPVDIFSAQSNLELFMYSFTYAPVKIQPVALNSQQPIERFKGLVAFGISNSPLYLNMEKPFNPILGQTFQCYIDGCPGYAQQISHHPPTAAFYLQGRGYKFTAQLESKVQLHVNSGCGTNQGIFNIQFDDGMKGCYITPGGQVSGLAYGDRKFNMIGKSYYWMESEGLFVQLIFNPTPKGFFSVGKQQKPIDYFEGTLMKVKPQFFKKFLKKRKGCPQQKQILQKYGKFHGVWHKQSYYNDQLILDIDNQFPLKLQYEPSPLPSDSNWRQDIAYRRILDISRSQQQKQRLQINQRKDRKLREKFMSNRH